MNSITFVVDKRLKKKFSRRAILDRTGGKVGIGLSFALLLAAVLGVVLVLAFDKEGVFDDLGPEVDAIFVGGTFFVCSIIGFLCTFVQQNARVLVRTDEEMSFDGGSLRYSFRIYNDSVGFSSSTACSRNEIVILPAKSSIDVNKRAKRVTFTGGVYGWHYSDTRVDQPKSLSEMEVIEKPFEISDYWKPSLIEALRL